ncbi:MMPL family transporter [Henriciella sp. AS95]|uniref:efflux RND transporter permease subunit n=1 Tax=Henriciella sp. AS95 TaxID=3135782 RepID=UPI0031801A69
MMETEPVYFRGDTTPKPLGTLQESLLRRPWRALLACLLLILVCGAGLIRVEKDPSVDAFVPGDHPAAINRDIAEQLFGLEDPVIIGLTVPEGETVFTPARLSALREIDIAVRQIDGVKKNDVISLASQNAISGNDGDLVVDPIVEAGLLSNADAGTARARFQSMPMLAGLLASEDERLISVIVPVEDPNKALATVEAISVLANESASGLFDVQIAGVAAMNARLSEMVDHDTKIFVPAAVVTVLLILFLALRSPAAAFGPFLVIAGSAAMAIGMMGWLGSHYYLITTALPVVIMAIGVADSLHISTYYLRARREDVELSALQATRFALDKAKLPVTLTSVTTIAAFIGLSFGAAMKPISEFGLFAALGVAAAWLLSLVLLPSILILTDLRPSQKALNKEARKNRVDAMVGAITIAVFKKPMRALAAVLVLVSLLASFALQAEFDYERQRYFTAADPVRQADQEINTRLGGVNFLDVVVSSETAGGLMTPKALVDIQGLRAQIGGLPRVAKVSGIDEYISLMHQVLTGAPAGSLPDAARAPGQYMFLYEASAPPEDFKKEIDFDHSRALIRAQLDTDNYRQTLPVVDQVEDILSAWQAESGLTADISGRVAVNDGWMSLLAQNHFRGLGLAIALVFLSTVLVFRSLKYAALSMVPVLVGIVSVYATMGLFGIDIAPATSMTAAIATGLGIDFGIHLISLVKRQHEAGAFGINAFRGGYDIVARACFYSAIALGVALAVICISSAPPLRWFGFLVSVGAIGSLVGALVIVPAIWSIGAKVTEGGKTHVVA